MKKLFALLILLLLAGLNSSCSQQEHVAISSAEAKPKDSHSSFVCDSDPKGYECMRVKLHTDDFD